MDTYWEECIGEAFEDAGITATAEQIQTVASWVEGGHENYGMANGYDVISKGAESQAERELREVKQEIQKAKEWENSTTPCTTCNTQGTVRDGWGRDVRCDACRGEGRV